VDDFNKCVIGNTNSLGITWRNFQWKKKILVERDIVTWGSRYLKEVQEYRDNGHLLFYTRKTWPDSNLTFHKCWQEGAVIGIHTHVNLGYRLILLHVGGTGGFLPPCTSYLQGWIWEAGDYHGQMNATNFEKWGAKKLTSNLPPQPVIVLDNSPCHCLQVDRPLSTCIVQTGMIWLSRKGIVSDETMRKMTYQLILPQKPKEISTKLIAYWLIMVMQFDCHHMCDLNL